MTATAELFEKAEIPPDPVSPDDKKDEETPAKSAGVPAGRLVGWSLPVVGLLVAAGLWTVSPLVALLAAGGTVVGGGMGWLWHRARKRRMQQKRQSRRSTRAWTVKWGRVGSRGGSSRQTRGSTSMFRRTGSTGGSSGGTGRTGLSSPFRGIGRGRSSGGGRRSTGAGGARGTGASRGGGSRGGGRGFGLRSGSRGAGSRSAGSRGLAGGRSGRGSAGRGGALSGLGRGVRGALGRGRSGRGVAGRSRAGSSRPGGSRPGGGRPGSRTGLGRLLGRGKAGATKSSRTGSGKRATRSPASVAGRKAVGRLLTPLGKGRNRVAGNKKAKASPSSKSTSQKPGALQRVGRSKFGRAMGLGRLAGKPGSTSKGSGAKPLSGKPSAGKWVKPAAPSKSRTNRSGTRATRAARPARSSRRRVRRVRVMKRQGWLSLGGKSGKWVKPSAPKSTKTAAPKTAAPKATGPSKRTRKPVTPPPPPPVKRTKPAPLPVDDCGWPSPPVRKMADFPKAARRVKPVEPIDVDECGWPIYNPAPAKRLVKNTRKGTLMDAVLDLPDYTAHVDQSTPETLARTCSEAADDARRSANKMLEEAEALRTKAANLQNKEDMAGTAQALLREAGLREEAAERRQGWAAGFEEAAAQAARRSAS